MSATSRRTCSPGLRSPTLSLLNPIARQWLDEVANVRVHGETRRRPVEMFEEERHRLQPLPETVHDFGTVHGVRACNRFRVTFETNRYSVPAEYASRRLTLKAYPDRVCIYHRERLIARHPRSYDRHRDFEHPDHPRRLAGATHERPPTAAAEALPDAGAVRR